MLMLKNIVKTYPGVVALDDVTISFEDGKVHALLGENGAGKSTLIKIIAGAVHADSGKIVLNDEEYSQITPQLAQKLGIAVIYQELNLVGPLSIAENIYLGRPQSKLYNKRQLESLASELFNEYGFNLKPSDIAMSISPAEQQIVEICKAISNKARYIIMDEPTASLATHEVEVLFRIIKKLKEQGVTIIYISHRLDEVFEVTDSITIMRDGLFVKKMATSSSNRQELVNLMVGRELTENFPSRTHDIGEVVLKAEKLTGNTVEDITLELHRGEILGIAGLVGSGRTEVVELFSGVAKATSGTLSIKNKPVVFNSPADAISEGVGIIPEERKEQGLVLFNTFLFNSTLICNKKYFRSGIVNNRKRKKIAEDYRKSLKIKIPDLNQLVINLSGGNQQKVVLAKTLSADLDIIIFDEPTRGIDVGTKQEIYQIMNELAVQGKAIIMISSEMDEILGMSDRIIVLYEGRIEGELQKDQFSQENVLTLGSGMEVSSNAN